MPSVVFASRPDRYLVPTF